MGRIIGVGAIKAPATFTEEDVANLTATLTKKVEELTAEKEQLTLDKTELETTVATLTKKVEELTAEKEKVSKKDKE